MHFYPHHIGDYRSATMHLSNAEDLAYRRLLEMYYDTEAPIPDDIPLVARRIRTEADCLEFVLKEFFKKTAEGWTNKRCTVVINDYHEMAERNRANGRKGGRPKANKQAQENPVGFQSVPSGMPVATQVEPNQEPITINHKPKNMSNRGSRLPTDLVLSEDWAAFCQQERQDLTPHKVFEQFKDYWTAQPGQKGVKLDWEATWRNWVRRQAAPRPSFAQIAADVARTTVPAVDKGPDPVLLKIAADREKAVPPPPGLRELIASMKGNSK
jgi:uncharacterized protein YdaU (DUF1376 family)